MVRQPDSASKLVDILATVTKKQFIYQRKWLYPPKELWLSKQFFRDFTCPEMCGGCCRQFTLDYFAGKRLETLKSKHPEYFKKFKPRMIEANTYKVLVYTYNHKAKSVFCDFLDERGRCPIHEANPLSCRLELIKFLRTKKTGLITKKLFGRGWEMKTLLGVGALCEMTPFRYKTFIDSDLPLIKELREIAEMFHLPTWLDKTIAILEEIKRTRKVPIESIKIN